MSSSLGFDGTNLQLDSFKTKPKRGTPSDDKVKETRAADRAGDKQGFTSREPVQIVQRVVRVRKEKEPSDSIYVRGPLVQLNRFKEFCNDENMSYGEAISYLLDNRPT